MSTASILDRARELLSLAPDTPPPVVREAAGARTPQWEIESKDPKKNPVRRSGVARKLSELLTLLPVVEIEGELHQLEAEVSSGRGPLGARKHEFRLRCGKLSARIAELPEKAPPEKDDRVIWVARLADVTAALSAPDEAEIRDLAAAGTTLLERVSGIPASDLPLAVEELADLGSRIDKLPDGTMRAELRGKRQQAISALESRRAAAEAGDIAAELQRCTEKITKLAAEELDAMRVGLEALISRIEKMPAGAGREDLRVKLQAALAALGARRGAFVSRDWEAALAAWTGKMRTATAAEVGALRLELVALATRLEVLPAGAARVELEQKAQWASQMLATREEVVPIEAALAQLAAAREAGRPESEIGRMCQLVKVRIAALPESEGRSSMERRLRATFSSGGRETVPAPPPEPLENGEVLRLLPPAGGGRLPPLVFVARSRFVLGRFPTRADAPVVADFSCPTHMKKIGRKHVILQRMGRDILAHDAESLNRSWLGEQELTNVPTPTRFATPQEIVLGLGPILTVVAQHLAAAAPEGPPSLQRDGSATFRQTLPTLLTGAMRFTPKPAMELPAQVTWIFTDASVGSGPANAVLLPPEFPGILARVHYWQKGFWFENMTHQMPVRILPARRGGELSLTAPGASNEPRLMAGGEVIHLRTGDILHFGAASYSVEVDA